MKRTNTQLLGEVLKEFMEDNPLLSQKLAERRLINAWTEVLGNAAERYTTRLFIKKKTLYVFLSSAVLRNELNLCRDELVKRLNNAAGSDVIDKIILS